MINWRAFPDLSSQPDGWNKYKSTYYQTSINDNSHDPKKLFAIMNDLLTGEQALCLPIHDDPAVLANEFDNYMYTLLER